MNEGALPITAARLQGQSLVLTPCRRHAAGPPPPPTTGWTTCRAAIHLAFHDLVIQPLPRRRIRGLAHRIMAAADLPAIITMKRMPSDWTDVRSMILYVTDLVAELRGWPPCGERQIELARWLALLVRTEMEAREERRSKCRHCHCLLDRKAAP